MLHLIAVLGGERARLEACAGFIADVERLEIWI